MSLILITMVFLKGCGEEGGEVDDLVLIVHSPFFIFYFFILHYIGLDADLKIVLVGAAAVGKTSLIHRYINDDFGNTTAVRLAFFSPWRVQFHDFLSSPFSLSLSLSL